MSNKTTNPTTPSLRFPEFSEDWSCVAVGDIVSEYRGGASLSPDDFTTNENKYEVIPKKAIGKGGVLRLDRNSPTYSKSVAYERNLSSVVDSKFVITALRDLVPSGPNIGYLVRNQHGERYLMAQGVYGFKFDKSFDDLFMIQLSNTEIYRKVMKRTLVGSTQVHIRTSDYFKIKLIIPSLEEQQKIASFLTSVDDWIENLKKQKEAQEKYKKGMMQKIFSQEIRFKDEDGKDYSKWEEKRLGEVAELFKGEGVSKQDIKNNGKYKCIRYGELYTLYSEQIKEVLSRTDIPFKRRSANNDVLMPTSDVTPTGLATASALSEENIILGGDILVIRSKRINNIFFSYYIGANKRDVMRLVNGVTVYHLYGSDMEKMNIKVPRFEEQQKIADFLSSIDDLINLSNQRITQAEEWKKGLMQRVFV